MANGAALVFHIAGNLPLPALLVVTWTVALIALGAIATVGGQHVRALIARQVAVGLVVGLAATLAYDVSKAVLSQLDPSPYDPFETTRVFGRILLGETAATGAVAIAGWGFHITNGCTFAVAFAALFARDGRISLRHGIIAGVVWALFLEVFQLVLFPGWLGIRFVDEFRQVSFLSHIVFGVSLGLLIPAGLRRIGRARERMG